MLRLTVVSQSADDVVLEVDGWLVGIYVKLLEREGKRLLRETEFLLLDLEGVKNIDRAGIALLQEWSVERLVLRGGSAFIQTLLKEYGLR